MIDVVELDDPNVVDDTESEKQRHTRFSITSYGADYPVETLVNRITRKDFYLPDFQRSYVWALPQASRFIESLLLGLPIPSLFLFRESDTNKHLIIDGQQRLRTLQYFKSGLFREKAFRLVDVSDPWLGKTYADLDDDDRRRFDDALIHAIIFKQEAPQADNSSIYEVFERLNSGGIKLSAQEIRVCVSHGKFIELLVELNKNEDWRAVFGEPSLRGKDQELVLRFLALKFGAKYEKPMKKFLDTFLDHNRNLSEATYAQFAGAFTSTIAVARRAFTDRAFRPERILNAAVFDSVMVGLSNALDKDPKRDIGKLSDHYQKLLLNADYVKSFAFATSDEDQVKQRIKLAEEAFNAA